MPQIEVEAGPIEYRDTGGEGPVLVLVPGLVMDYRQWERVVPELRDEFRCISVTLPMGAHRRPMKPDADLSMIGMGRILAELLERLDLRDVVVCFNDWSGAQAMIADERTDRIAKFVLASCETVGNYPPGLGGMAAWLSAKLPGGIAITRQVLLRPRLARLPFLFGQMSKRGIPDEMMRHWLEPLARPEIRRDLRRYTVDAIPNGRRTLRMAQQRLGTFERPVLVVWDAEGKMMPNDEGRRLAESFPNSRFVELADCYTLIALDQPAKLAHLIRDFAR
ncbi:MAG TPA: alpha/beta hydrolase [Solirubrobacterales bacterium]|jgi:pimeloyl-ACP methyl ester carboxylesterase|nr:alpha/beta hydrolase [Solirubrobacterales bacterium]